jgi:membrane protein required for colicin V production
VLVSIAYLFYSWLLPLDRQEDWVRNAVSLPVVRGVGKIMLDFMPPDIASTLTNSALTTNPAAPAANSTAAITTGTEQAGYSTGQTKGLDNLIEGSGQQAEEPAFGQGTTQQ